MDKKVPFFTVVIPTKNRPDYLRDAIESVLRQNFDDFEVLVSDNYNEQPTQDVIADFSNHPKFHSIRTSEELNMISHWEFATKHATGKYVLLLADRKMYFQGALKKIAQALKSNPDINAFSLGVQIYNDEERKMGWRVPVRPTERHQSSALIANFLDTNYFSTNSLDFIMPKTLNGGYKNEFARKVREDNRHYFNNHGVTTPDYSSLFINLALNEEVLHIGGEIMLWQGEKSSNGRNFGLGKFQAYMNSLGLTDPYPLVPIKAPFIYNLLHVDFWTIEHIFGGNLSKASMNWNNYFYTNYWELLVKKEFKAEGVDLTFFEEHFEDGLNAKRSLATEFDKTAVEMDYNRPTGTPKFDKVKNFKSHLRDFVSHRMPNNKLVHSLVKIHYASALEAAGFKEK